MKKIIFRIADSKYLVSLKNNTWTENKEEATSFSPVEIVVLKVTLYKTYSVTDLKEIIV